MSATRAQHAPHPRRARFSALIVVSLLVAAGLPFLPQQAGSSAATAGRSLPRQGHPGAVLAASPSRAAGRSSAPSRTPAPDLATGPPYWLPVTSMHNQRTSFAAAVGRDGRIYALGGALGSDATVEVYIPATNSWYFVASMPQARYMFAAAAGPDGRIYAIPGNSPEIVVGVSAYVPRQNRWVDVENTLDSHVSGAATTGPDGRLYALGGDSVDILISTTEAYDTHTGH